MRSKSITPPPLSSARSTRMLLAVGSASWEIGVHRHPSLRSSGVSFPSLWSKQAHYRQDTSLGPWRKLAAKPPWLIATFNGRTAGAGDHVHGPALYQNLQRSEGNWLLWVSSCSQSITGSKGERGEANKDRDVRMMGRGLVEGERCWKESDGGRRLKNRVRAKETGRTWAWT